MRRIALALALSLAPTLALAVTWTHSSGPVATSSQGLNEAGTAPSGAKDGLLLDGLTEYVVSIEVESAVTTLSGGGALLAFHRDFSSGRWDRMPAGDILDLSLATGKRGFRSGTLRVGVSSGRVAYLTSNVTASDVATVTVRIRGQQRVTDASGHPLFRAITPLLFAQVESSSSQPNRFSCALSAITATTLCKAAPGAGASLYVTDVWLANGTTTASTINLIYADAGACTGSPTNVTPPTSLTSTAASGSWTVFMFQTPVKIPANKTLCCKTAGSTAFSCLVSGYIAP